MLNVVFVATRIALSVIRNVAGAGKICHSQGINLRHPLQFTVCIVFLSPCTRWSGQYLRIGIDGNIPLGKLDEMNNALLIANPAQKSDLMKRLGIRCRDRRGGQFFQPLA